MDRMVEWLSSIFNQFGWPKFLRSDSGPPYRGGFSEFCRRTKITWVPSSAHNPKRNRAIERSIRIIKDMIHKNKRTGASLEESLFRLQNTPQTPESMTPSMRPVRDPELLALDDGRDETGARASVLSLKRRKREKKNLDIACLDNNPVPLRVGLQGLSQDCKTHKWDIAGKVTYVRPTGCSAIIWVLSRAKSYLCNRCFIRLNLELEFDSEDKGETPPDVVYMTYRKRELQAMQSLALRSNKSGQWQREQKHRKLSFLELDSVGPTGLPVRGKRGDGQDIEYRECVTKVIN